MLMRKSKRQNCRIEAIHDEHLRRRHQQERLLEFLHRRDFMLSNIYMGRVAAFVLESSINMTFMNQDIFYEIFLATPNFITQSTHLPLAYQTQPYWTIEHLPLNDHSQHSCKLFKTHYQITLAAFNSLVEKLSLCQGYIGSQTHGGFPVEVQVATVPWRFANSTYGFRIMNETVDITDGSYNNFTNRFIKAMRKIGESVIIWPLRDPQRCILNPGKFLSKGTAAEPRLPQVIDTMNGKLINIQKPSKHGNLYIDRKNHASLSLLGACNHNRRFMIGGSG